MKSWIEEKIFSRKLLVYVVATTAFFTNFLSEENWIIVSIVYIGGESIIDVFNRYKNKKEE